VTTGLVITGTRHREEVDADKLRAELDKWIGRFDKLYVGDATGVDEIALSWAKELKADWQKFDADWDKFRYRAGPERNGRMLRTAIVEQGSRGKVIVLAWPGLSPKGTLDCVKQAIGLGCWVRAIGPNAGRLFK